MAGLAFLLGLGVRFGVFPPFCGGLPFFRCPRVIWRVTGLFGFPGRTSDGLPEFSALALDGLSECSGRPLFDVRGVASLAGESVPVMLVVARTTKPFALQSWLVTSKYT